MYSMYLCIKTSHISKDMAYGWHYIFIYEIIVELNFIINNIKCN